MDTAAIAARFAALCKDAKFDEAAKEFWSEDVVSVEPMGDAPVHKGVAANMAKAEWWYANHEVHGVQVAGPYVNGDQFALRMTIDVTPKGGERMTMDEVALYTVKDGKVAEERFFYGM